jgi:hypothetical protein
VLTFRKECKILFPKIIIRVEASCVKFLKRRKMINKDELVELVTKDLLQMFLLEISLFNEILDKLIKSDYCKVIEG